MECIIIVINCKEGGVLMDKGNFFCEKCGSPLEINANFCTKCGAPVDKSQQYSGFEATSSKNYINNSVYINPIEEIEGKKCNKWISFFLCFFLGWLGAHKFYEGKTAMGFFYLFTFGFFIIGILSDLIIILSKPNTYMCIAKN